MQSSDETIKSLQNEEQSTIKVILFSTGYFLNTYLMLAFNNFVWTFYEGELGMIELTSFWPIYMAIANTIFTIWSMIMNPLLGYLTDKPMKWTRRLGFHTPWIIISGIPSIIFFFLLFTPPQVTGNESILTIFVYYLIVVAIYDLCYSILQTHSFGAFAAHFRGDKARRKGGIFTQTFTFLANFLSITIFSQIIHPGTPSTFTVAAFVSIIILSVTLITFIPGSKESDVIKQRFIGGYERAEKISFLRTMKMALREKNFMLVLLSYTAFMTSIGLVSMNSVNFVDDILHEQQSIRSIGAVLMLLFSIPTIPLWARLSKKLGHSNTYALGLILFGGSIFFYFFIFNAFGFYLLSIFGGISSSLFLVMLSPVLADCYDEIALKTKKHHESTLVGIRNVFVRFSLTIQSFIIGIIHIITSYNPNNTVHSYEALLGLRIIQAIIPFFICMVGALIFYKWFDLKGIRKLEIMQKLREFDL
ncbi:MAG: MFS transporter [Candidatus Hermodarchaeota archaeon]